MARRMAIAGTPDLVELSRVEKFERREIPLTAVEPVPGLGAPHWRWVVPYGGQSGMVIGAIIALIGWIVLLIGISRVSAGIDYRMNSAPVPVSPVERREQESKLAASEE